MSKRIGPYIPQIGENVFVGIATARVEDLEIDFVGSRALVRYIGTNIPEDRRSEWVDLSRIKEIKKRKGRK